MKQYTVEVHEEVHATIEVKVRAKSAKQAAQMAREAWVGKGVGELNEAVDNRWVEVDGKFIETKED